MTRTETCTHECPACGTAHYAESDSDFRSRCRGCGELVKLRHNPDLRKKVAILE